MSIKGFQFILRSIACVRADSKTLSDEYLFRNVHNKICLLDLKQVPQTSLNHKDFRHYCTDFLNCIANFSMAIIFLGFTESSSTYTFGFSALITKTGPEQETKRLR